MKNKKYKDWKKVFHIILIVSFLIQNILCNLSFAQESESLIDVVPKQVKMKVTLTPPYIVGPGDQLSIVDRTLRELFGQVERYDLVVSSDGYISIPLPDGTQYSLLAAGYTVNELSDEIRELFGKTLKNPLVFVQLSRYRPINIYIGGEIVNPGVYKVETSTTQAEDGKTSATTTNTFELSLTQVIQLAGGLKPRADIRAITVTRGSNSEKRIVDLKALVTGDRAFEDVNLQPGDAVFVLSTDKIEDQAQGNVVLLGRLAYQEVAVNVVGDVVMSGNFTLPNDATIFDAIGSAGGTDVVGTTKKVRIARFDDKGVYRWKEYNLDNLLQSGTKLDQIALRPNDRIEVRASHGKAVRNFLHTVGSSLVYVVGQNVGTFILQDHMFRRISHQSKGLRSGTNSSLLGGGGSGVTVIQANRSSDGE